MRKFFGASGLLIFMGVMWAGITAAAPPKARSFDFNYHVVIKEIPAQARDLKVWLPLLPHNDYQLIDAVTIEPKDSYTVTTDKTYQNRMISYTFLRPQASEIKINIHYKVKRYEYSKKGGLFSARENLSKEKEPLGRYLQADRLVTVTADIQQLASQLTKGKKTTLQKARALYDYVFKNVSYDKTIPGWGNGDTARVCLVKAGNCTDFHSLFISLARAAGIAAKFVIGVPIQPDQKEGQIKGYHCWAEFYDEKLGWVPVDISEAWKDKSKREYYFGAIGEDRLEFTHGRDIVLEPAQNGEPLNYFVYPYVELNGQEFKSVETTFQYKEQIKERG